MERRAVGWMGGRGGNEMIYKVGCIYGGRGRTLEDGWINGWKGKSKTRGEGNKRLNVKKRGEGKGREGNRHWSKRKREPLTAKIIPTNNNNSHHRHHSLHRIA